MSDSCSSRLSSWMSLWLQQKLELVVIRIQKRASLLQILNKIPKFWVICLSLSQKIWPQDKFGFKPIWASLCNCGSLNSMLQPWLLYSEGSVAWVLRKQRQYLLWYINIFVFVCVGICMHDTYMHTCNPATEKTQLNYQADSFFHWLIQETHTYSAPFFFQILF